MNAQGIWNLIKNEPYASMNDADCCAAVNASTVDVRGDFYINYRTILDVVNATARFEAIRARVQAAWPTVHSMLLGFGPNDGTAGGINVANELTRSNIQAIVGPGDDNLRQAEADTLKRK